MSHSSLATLRRSIARAMPQTSLTTLTVSDVPKYLHTSELYLSFSDEPDDEISVPNNCIKPDTSITTATDLLHVLQTMRFWILTSFPKEVVEYLVDSAFCLNNKSASVIYVLAEFDHVFPGAFPLVCELKTCQLEQLSNRACNLAARYGRVDFMKYFLDQKKLINSRTLEIAVSNGHTDCAKFIYEFLVQLGQQYRRVSLGNVTNRHPSDPIHQERISTYNGRYCCVLAVQSGKVECLKFLLSVFQTRGESITSTAVQQAKVSMLRCALEHGCEVNTATWETALQEPGTACLSYLLDIYPDALTGPDVLPKVASARTPALQLLLEKRHPFTPELIARAAKADNMECLLFLHGHLHYDVFVPSTIATVAGTGVLQVVKQLHKHGCVWDDTAPTAALRADEPSCLMFFIRLRGVPKSAEYRSVEVGTRCMAALNTYKSDTVRDRAKQVEQGEAAVVKGAIIKLSSVR